MSYQIEFYNTKVQTEILAWPASLAARFTQLALRMQEHGADLGMPHTRAMGAGLFEMRMRSTVGIGRAFYCTMKGQRIIVLHGFVKKTQATPIRELELARKRMKEVHHEAN
jgi:phage-related protein